MGGEGAGAPGAVEGGGAEGALQEQDRAVEGGGEEGGGGGGGVGGVRQAGLALLHGRVWGCKNTVRYGLVQTRDQILPSQEVEGEEEVEERKNIK